MVKKSVGAVSALALFAGLSTAALAQGAGSDERLRPGQNAAPSAQEATPGQKQMSPGQPGAQQRGEQVQTQERSPGETKRQQAQQPDGKQPRRAEDSDRKQPQRAEQPDGKKRAEQPDGKKRAEQPDGKQRAEQPDGKQRADQPDGKKRAEQPDGKQRADQPDGKQRADQPDSKRQQAERQDGKRLSEEKRTVVRERFRESADIDRARVANVNFNISVGTRVPRERVKLVTLPTVIVQEVPQYRGYLYFAVSDEIVIVEPDTYVIVEVIKLDGSKGRTARLTLSSSQRDVILSHVDRRADVRLGIGGISIGMDVPGTVELRAFPQVVVSEVPELRSYRYFVYDDEVAIVSPDDRQVVLTISN